MVKRGDFAFTSPSSRGNYNDRFVAIDGGSGTLTVKHWLVTHRTLRLSVSDISYILPVREATSRWGVRAWGIGGTGVAWARDFKRIWRAGDAFERSFVMKFEDRKIRAGFTVENPEAFRWALEATLPGVTMRQKDQGKR